MSASAFSAVKWRYVCLPHRVERLDQVMPRRHFMQGIEKSKKGAQKGTESQVSLGTTVIEVLLRTGEAGREAGPSPVL